MYGQERNSKSSEQIIMTRQRFFEVLLEESSCSLYFLGCMHSKTTRGILSLNGDETATAILETFNPTVLIRHFTLYASMGRRVARHTT